MGIIGSFFAWLRELSLFFSFLAFFVLLLFCLLGLLIHFINKIFTASKKKKFKTRYNLKHKQHTSQILHLIQLYLNKEKGIICELNEGNMRSFEPHNTPLKIKPCSIALDINLLRASTARLKRKGERRFPW